MGQIVNSTRKEEEVQEMFSRYIGEKESKNGSKRNDISTGSVLKELNKDGEFMAIFREFVKYEQMIVDFAMDMHQKQYEAVNKVLIDPVLVWYDLIWLTSLYISVCM